ncbi:MAG: hypothetical protein ACTSR2_06750 [Candidatus Hodarchaeales archaeon]
MDCELLRLMFNKNQNYSYSINRSSQIEGLLVLGKINKLRFEFLKSICHHPNQSITIHWRDIKILTLKCEDNICEITVESRAKNIFFQLIQPLIQHPEIRYLSILNDIRLPYWEKYYEFIFVLNRAGKTLIIPTEKMFSLKRIDRLKKDWLIIVQKFTKQKEEMDILDLASPRPFSYSDFKIIPEMK